MIKIYIYIFFFAIRVCGRISRIPFASPYVIRISPFEICVISLEQVSSDILYLKYLFKEYINIYITN